MTRKLCLAIMFMQVMNDLSAQATYDSSFHYYYYDQKLSLFELMPDSKDEIVWLGDSITDIGEWNELFPNQKNLNRGISSDNTFGVLNRLKEITRRKPKKIFLMIGINDIARNIPDQIILQNFKRIIRQISEETPSTKLYIQSILPTNNDFTLFPAYQNKISHIQFINKELKSLCTARKIRYIDLFSYFTNEQGKLDKRYTNDGVHLTGIGFNNWKKVLLANKFM